MPAGKVVHVILDNYATHKHPKVLRWLSRHPRFDVPLHADLVLLVERDRDVLRHGSPDAGCKRGVFRSIVELQAAINRFIEDHNVQPQAVRMDR